MVPQIIFMLLATPVLMENSYLESAQHKSCVGPLRLTALESKIPIETWTYEDHQVLEAPLEIGVYASRIKRRVHYCPDSFTELFGGSCTDEELYINMDEDELSLTKSDLCKVGEECSSDTCTGSLVSKCTSDSRPNTMFRGPLSWSVGDTKLVRYSCTQAWGCETRYFIASPHSKEDYTGFKIKGLAGEDLNLTSFQKGKGGWHYWMNNFTIREEARKLQCIGSKHTRLCKYKDNPQEFALVESGGGRDRNFIIVPKTRTSSDGWGDLTGPTTIDELKHTLTKIVYSDLRDKHNTLTLLKKIASIERQILAIIEGDYSAALKEAVGRRHNAYPIDKLGYMVCPLAHQDPAPATTGINVMETEDVMLGEISTAPVIDEALQAEVIEALSDKETVKNTLDEEKPVSIVNSFSPSWLAKETLFMTGSVCGIVSVVILILGRK